MSSSTPGEILTSSQMSTVMRRVTKSLGGAAVKAMREAAYVGKARAVQSIDEVPQFNSDVKTPPVDLGQMRSSYKVDRVADGAILENVAPHAAHQEFGTRPFIAPMGVLQAWAERKVRRGKPRAKRAQKFGPKMPQRLGPKAPEQLGPRFQKPLSDAKQAEANALANRAFSSIRKRGIIPKGYHAHASGYFGGYVERALANQLKEVTK